MLLNGAVNRFMGIFSFWFVVMLMLFCGCINRSGVGANGAATEQESVGEVQELQAPEQLPKLVLASWNVENLFDTEDDPDNEGDDEFLPTSWRRWTPWRYNLKLRHLAEVVAAMQPDILCLTEIENRRVLEDLATVLREHEEYAMDYIFHRDGPDPRGIDVAMISRHEACNTNWIITATRETLAVDFRIAERELTVLVNHWKSQLGKKEESDAVRRADATAVRFFLDERLAANSNAAILVTGDFNDKLDSPILTETAGFWLEEERVRQEVGAGLLYNLSGSLPVEERGTFWYNAGKRWESLDSMSVTRGMLKGIDAAAPWQVEIESYGVFKTEAQMDEDGRPIPFRFVRSKIHGNAYKTGYSDHFPIIVTLVPYH